MKKAPLLAAVALMLTACGGPAASVRTHPPVAITVRTAASVPAARAGLSAARVGNTIWIVGGLSPMGAPTSSLWAYRPDGGVQAKTSLPFPVADAAVAAGEGGLLLWGGRGGMPSRTDGLIRLPAGRFTPLASLPVPLSQLWGGVVAGAPTVLGGYTGAKASTDVWRDEKGTWISLTLLPYGARYPAVARNGDTLYLAGGLTTGVPGQGGPNSGVVSLSPKGDVTSLGALPVALYRAGAAWVDGALYVFGGESSKGYLNTVYRFDASSGKATLVGHLPKAWSYGAVVQEGRTVYLIGGENASGPLATVWRVTIKSR